MNETISTYKLKSSSISGKVENLGSDGGIPIWISVEIMQIHSR